MTKTRNLWVPEWLRWLTVSFGSGHNPWVLISSPVLGSLLYEPPPLPLSSPLPLLVLSLK